MRWYVVHNGREAGPFSPDQLREMMQAKKLRPEHLLHAEGDSRLFKASDTTLFSSDSQRDSSGRIPSGTIRPVNIETGFQPAPYGSMRPSDGYLGGIWRVATSFPALGLVATVVILVVVGATIRQRSFHASQSGVTERDVATLVEAPVQQKADKLGGQVNELNAKIRKWRESRDRIAGLVGQMQRDRLAILERLDQLGVSSDSDLTKSPRAGVLSDELTDVLQQLALYQKKHEEYDLAIFRSESRLRTIERRLAAKDAGLSDAELEELTRSMITLDESLASEQDVNQIALPSLDDALAKELDAFRAERKSHQKINETMAIVFIDISPKDARLVVTGSGVSVEGEGRYRQVKVTSPDKDQPYTIVALHEGFVSFSKELQLEPRKNEFLSIQLTIAAANVPTVQNAATATVEKPTAQVSELVPVGELNTRANELHPWVSPDGLTIYWTGANPVGENPNPIGTIWTATRRSATSKFEQKKPLFEGAYPTVSSDGLQMLLIGARTDGKKGGSIFTTSRKSLIDLFGPARRVEELSSVEYPRNLCLVADGLSLYFNHGLVKDNTFGFSMTTRQSSGSKWESPAAVRIEQPDSLVGVVAGCFLTANSLEMFGTLERPGTGVDPRFMRWSRTSTDVPFSHYEFLTGFADFHGWSPRYVETCDELYLTSQRLNEDGNWDLWVVKNLRFRK